ncbi:MAG: LPXTG cell wall anchor domain-containing protein [Clostridia bacterium]
MKIVVKDERAPETGDIAVVVFVVIAVVCIAGILFVVIRNKKKNNK